MNNNLSDLILAQCCNTEQRDWNNRPRHISYFLVGASLNIPSPSILSWYWNIMLLETGFIHLTTNIFLQFPFDH